MAEHADPSRVTRIRSGARAIYPWNEWTDGEWWRLYEGTDYTLSTDSFQRVARKYAHRNGWRLTTQLTEDGTFVRFTRPENDSDDTKEAGE
jgi:hypothetical protein